MTALSLTVHGTRGARALAVDISRCYNLSFTMRDSDALQRHLDEVYALGVKEVSCDRPPLVMPINTWSVVTDADIQVQRARTSGEVEIVTIVDRDGAVYVGVGSDHSDRALEILDVPWSKQVTPNIVAPDLWAWEDVADHWDEISMECTVVDDGETVLYQRTLVSEFWTPTEMVEGTRDVVVTVEGAVVLFSGTVETVDGSVRYAPSWTISLIDPVLERRIDHTYTVTVLETEILNGSYGMG